MNRRVFLWSSVYGADLAVLTGCGGGSAGAEASSTDTALADRSPSMTAERWRRPRPSPSPNAIVRLSLTSPRTLTNAPWTFGQVFKQGDIPAGRYITTDAPQAQAIVRNRWPDGSVKFAVLSGLSSLAANTPTVVAINATTTAPSSTNVAEPTQLDARITFTGGVTGTYAVQSALGIDGSTWSRTRAARIRRILGPVMSEFHYFVPTSDAHVTIWFYVRAYVDGSAEVETVVENGWIGVAQPGQRNYGVTCVVGGVTTYTGTLSHFSHTRWSRVDWIGTNPVLVPKHDAAYLRATKMVPNYGYTSPSAAAFSGLASAINPQPFALGNWEVNMAATGYAPAIGVLPQWESLYATTADPRAYAATISNNRGSGRWPLHYRDENTGRVSVYSAYPNTTFTTGWGTQPTSPSGGTTSWDIPHHPSNGYLAYLIEGRWTQLESLQFSAMTAILESNPVTRQGGGVLACINAPMTTRGAAWAWRTMGQAAAIGPSSFNGASLPAADTAVGVAFVNSIRDTASWIKARYIDGTIDSGAHKNSIGWIGQYDQYLGSNIPVTEWWGGSWMVAFQGMALGHIADLGIEGLTNQSDLETVRNFVYGDALLIIGNESTWNFRRAGVYERPYLKNTNASTPAFMTIAEAFASYKRGNNLVALSANAGDTLKQHDSEADVISDDTSNVGAGYWALKVSVLAQAVDANVQGAANAYALVKSASNFDPTSAHNTPEFAFVPRS